MSDSATAKKSSNTSRPKTKPALALTVEKDPNFLIDELLPAREVHLVAGPSGAGKSRWLFDTLLDWEKGRTVLGHNSHPVPWVYVSADRSLDSVQRTFDDLGIPPGSIKVIPAWDQQMSFNRILDEVSKSKAKMVVIEAFGSFVDPPANSACVKKFLSSTCSIARREGLTVIGVVESPKQKPLEKYENPRQRISGAASWGHFSETIILVEMGNPKSPSDPTRKLFVCPRNAPSIERDGGFDAKGHIVFPPR